MMLLIFSSSQEVLCAARAKWNHPRYRGNFAGSDLVYHPSVMVVDWVSGKRLVIGKSSVRGEAILAASHLN